MGVVNSVIFTKSAAIFAVGGTNVDMCSILQSHSTY